MVDAASYQDNFNPFGFNLATNVDESWALPDSALPFDAYFFIDEDLSPVDQILYAPTVQPKNNSVSSGSAGAIPSKPILCPPATQLSGSRRCQYPGCSKCAQGSTKFCIGHGGGRRCTYPACTKAARDKFFCAAHGGGKRCSAPNCTKSAVGGSALCTSHGGGRRCQARGCTKSSQSSTNFCVRHGGGRKCIAHSCTKVARGRTDFCAAHANSTAALALYCQASRQMDSIWDINAADTDVEEVVSLGKRRTVTPEDDSFIRPDKIPRSEGQLA